MRILFVSHTDPFGPFRVGSHHLSGALAREGHDVVHLSTPISLAHLVSRRISRAKADATPADVVGADGVRYLVPRTVLPAGVGPYRASRTLRRAGLTGFDLILVDQPLLWARSLRRMARRLVYRPTDEYPAGLKARRQRDILRHADGVVATSHEVLRRLGALEIPHTVIENGVDIDRFAFAGPAAEPRPKVCVYVGAFDARFDWNQVLRWAHEFPEWRFALAGPITAAPDGLPANVDLLGPVRYDELPELLSSARVGLLPFSADPLNQGRSPMKLYEYLASGLAVAARQTAVIGPDPEAGIFTYADSAQASAALRAAAEHVTPNVSGYDRARGQSWTNKRTRLLEFAASLPRRSRTSGGQRR